MVADFWDFIQKKGEGRDWTYYPILWKWHFWFYSNYTQLFCYNCLWVCIYFCEIPVFLFRAIDLFQLYWIFFTYLSVTWEFFVQLFKLYTIVCNNGLIVCILHGEFYFFFVWDLWNFFIFYIGFFCSYVAL